VGHTKVLHRPKEVYDMYAMAEQEKPNHLSEAELQVVVDYIMNLETRIDVSLQTLEDGGSKRDIMCTLRGEDGN